MATIQIEFSGTATDLDDFCAQHNYQETVADPENPGETIPNPETKKDFFIRKVKEFVYESVKAKRINTARESAGDVEREKTISF